MLIQVMFKVSITNMLIQLIIVYKSFVANITLKSFVANITLKCFLPDFICNVKKHLCPKYDGQVSHLNGLFSS